MQFDLLWDNSPVFFSMCFSFWNTIFAYRKFSSSGTVLRMVYTIIFPMRQSFRKKINIPMVTVLISGTSLSWVPVISLQMVLHNTSYSKNLCGTMFFEILFQNWSIFCFCTVRNRTITLDVPLLLKLKFLAIFIYILWSTMHSTTLRNFVRCMDSLVT